MARHLQSMKCARSPRSTAPRRVRRSWKRCPPLFSRPRCSGRPSGASFRTNCGRESRTSCAKGDSIRRIDREDRGLLLPARPFDLVEPRASFALTSRHSPRELQGSRHKIGSMPASNAQDRLKNHRLKNPGPGARRCMSNAASSLTAVAWRTLD
jgi:hypothetical protein